MLNLRLAQRWERLRNRDAELGVMLLFALLAGLFVWGAYAVAYPEHGCVRMGKGNSGPLECDPQRLFNYGVVLLSIRVLTTSPIFYILWGWMRDMARPLSLKEDQPALRQSASEPG